MRDRHRGRSHWRIAVLATALAALSVLAGCQTMRLEVAPGPAAQPVEERQSFFFWGLTPTVQVDMRSRCPYGVAQLIEETTFFDGLFEVLTLGIWAPRTTTYRCLDVPLEG
jgi:hypothetical protein